jgi:hypothetical protein
MKDKEERKLQFVLRYYEDGKLDTRKALKKITGIAHQNKVSGFWACFSGIAAAILICVVSYPCYFLQGLSCIQFPIFVIPKDKLEFSFFFIFHD